MTNYDAIEQLTKLKSVCEHTTESEEPMNGFKYELDNLLDELEHCCVCQHFEITDDIRAKIHKLIEDKIKEK